MAETKVLDLETTDAAAKARIFDDLMTDPDIRNQTLRNLQKLHPDVYLPEVRVMDAVETRVKGLEDKLKADSDKREQDGLREKLEGEKKNATRGMSAEQVTELETLMTTRRIGDYGTARELYDLKNKPATPTGVSVRERQVTMPTTLADIQKNPQRWARNQAAEAIDDLNRKRAEAERA